MQDLNADEKAQHLVDMALQTMKQASNLQVRSPREYEQVSESRKSIKAKFKEIEGYRVHLKEPFLLGCRRIDDFFKPALKFLKDAEDTTKDHLINYENEQKRQAAEQQRKLEAEARKKREALEAKARAEREEADAKAAELKRAADAAREAGNLNESVTLNHQANKVVEKSEVKAENTLTKAAQVVAPKVEAYIPPVVGQHTRERWCVEIVDAALVPREFLIVDEKALNAVANATKGKLIIPGVKFYSKRIMAGGSR